MDTKYKVGDYIRFEGEYSGGSTDTSKILDVDEDSWYLVCYKYGWVCPMDYPIVEARGKKVYWIKPKYVEGYASKIVLNK